MANAGGAAARASTTTLAWKRRQLHDSRRQVLFSSYLGTASAVTERDNFCQDCRTTRPCSLLRNRDGAYLMTSRQIDPRDPGDLRRDST